MFRAPLSSRHQAVTVCAPHEGVAGKADLEYDAPFPGDEALIMAQWRGREIGVRAAEAFVHLNSDDHASDLTRL